MKTRCFPVLCVLSLLASCATDKVTGERKFALVKWSLEEELEMGRSSAPLVEAQFDSVYTDREATDYLRGIVLEMTEHSVRKDDFPYEFHVLNSSIPNAFALPGGQVYITRGLLTMLESEGQFVSILGHELGHVEHQHAMFSQSRGLLAGLPGRTIGSIGRNVPIVGGVTGTAGNLLNVAPALFVLEYDRSQELEADLRGIYFSDEMGYDPREGLKTFELFQRMEEESGNSGQLSIFSTHPANDTRIERMESAIAKEYPEVTAKPASSFRSGGGRFATIVEDLRAKAPAYAAHDRAYAILAQEEDRGAPDRAAAELHRAVELVPDEPIFHVGLGELSLVRGDLDGARASFERAALLYDDFSSTEGHWKPYFFLGLLALEDEDTAGALRWLRAGEPRCPVLPEMQFLLGLAEEVSGNTGAARRHYERVTELAPSDAEIHRAARERLRML